MKKVFIVLFILLLSAGSYAATNQIGSSESVAPENAPALLEFYRIKIENKEGGEVAVSRDEGINWKVIGKVLLPTDKLSNTGYTASRWVDDGHVAAVAVNAIHIKTDYNFTDDRGVIFSLLPVNSYKKPKEKAKEYNSYLSPSSTIYTDIKGGTGIFGGDFSPFVGNVVATADTYGDLYPTQRGYTPRVGDDIVIVVKRPVRYPKEIVFENRFGGLISIKYNDGDERYVGQVLQPIEGVGRFIGTSLADVGRIRAAHAGVIDISTSPLGHIGGFQITPSKHGMSKEMKNARMLTQWMVIGPMSALDPSYEGVAPFFKYYLQPKYGEADIEEKDWEERLLQRFLVQVRYKEKKEWEPMPLYMFDPNLSKPLPRWAFSAMENVSHIRILFPMYRQY
ncbi:hypothetical protein ACFLZ2_06110 [Candidatus Margulisiibacteriota bacterium]